MIFSTTASADSRTTIFSPLTNVITVSGVVSIYWMRSELTIVSIRFSLVSLTITDYSTIVPYVLRQLTYRTTHGQTLTKNSLVLSPLSLVLCSFVLFRCSAFSRLCQVFVINDSPTTH